MTWALSSARPIVCLGILLLSPVVAAEVLTWDACVNEAAQNNADLKATRASLQAAQYQVQAARGGFYPQVSANVNSSRGATTTSDPGGISALSGSEDRERSSSANVSLTQNLFAGFQTEGAVRQAQANEKIAQANLAGARARVSFELKSGYAALLYAQNFIGLTKDIIQRRQENLKIVELRFESGNENRGSVLLSQAYLKDAQLNYLQAQNALAGAQKQLAQALGRNESDALQVAGEIPVAEPDEKVDLKALLEQVPDHLAALARVEAADAAVTLARAPLYPSVNLVGSMGQTERAASADSNAWSVGLNLSYPLFAGGKDYYNKKAALENFSVAATNREGTDQALLTRLRQALSGYVEASAKLQVDQNFLEAAMVRENIGRSRYNNGLLSFDQWDIIENDLISRQKSVLQSARERVVSEAAWEQTQGKGVIP